MSFSLPEIPNLIIHNSTKCTCSNYDDNDDDGGDNVYQFEFAKMIQDSLRTLRQPWNLSPNECYIVNQH